MKLSSSLVYLKKKKSKNARTIGVITLGWKVLIGYIKGINALCMDFCLAIFNVEFSLVLFAF